MPLRIARYDEVRAGLHPGDVVAFGSSDIFSRLISLAMSYPVCHVGIVAAVDDGAGPVLVHAVMYGRSGPHGVQRVALDEVMRRCRSNVWWLPLRAGSLLDAPALERYFADVVATRFDPAGALRAVLSELCERVLGQDLSELDGDGDQLYCAELAATALIRAGVLPAVDPSDASPRDICRWAIYADHYYHIGMLPPLEVPDFNSIAPGTSSGAWQDREAFVEGGRRLARELRAAGDAAPAERVDAAVRRLRPPV